MHRQSYFTPVKKSAKNGSLQTPPPTIAEQETDAGPKSSAILSHLHKFSPLKFGPYCFFAANNEVC